MWKNLLWIFFFALTSCGAPSLRRMLGEGPVDGQRQGARPGKQGASDRPAPSSSGEDTACRRACFTIYEPSIEKCEKPESSARRTCLDDALREYRNCKEQCQEEQE